MGFSLQLREIIHRLPSTRQSLLFSATLPAAVTEFAKAGLSNPTLVRLDADQSISPDLNTVFVHVSPADKISALFSLLESINIPLAPEVLEISPQAIIFVATKHHVEFLNTLLDAVGYSCSLVYGSLDQVARHRQLERFRKRLSSLLIVTDVAARGLDIPVLEHVVNFDLPPTPRVYVHRVGRTARAGRKGNAWSLVSTSDLPYYFDLNQLADSSSKKLDLRLRTIPRHVLDDKNEYITSAISEHSNLPQLRQVMDRAQSMYERSRNKASSSSIRDAKEFRNSVLPGLDDPLDQADTPVGFQIATSRNSLIAQIGAFRPRDPLVAQGVKRLRPSSNGRKSSATRAKSSSADSGTKTEGLDLNESKVSMDMR